MVERMAYYGIASNLVVYLTKELHEGTVKSSKNVTNWVGVVWFMPAIGAYIADAYLGRYSTFLISSAIYLLGMCLLTLAVSLPALKPPPCPQDKDCQKATSLQVGLFFLGLYIIAVGTGGTKPNISTMGADQFDKFEPKEKAQKISFFNWWVTFILIGTIFSNTVLVYIQDNVGWALGYGIPTGGLLFSILVFLFGTPFYRHKSPSGSPLTRMLQVIVAAVRKWKLEVPDDPKELYELTVEEYAINGRNRIYHSPSLSFLDKAAIKTKQTQPWMLCTMTQVEETKQMMKMVPIMVTTCMPSTVIAQANTLFIKQGTTLDRSIGPNFKIPPACLTAFINIFMLLSVVTYDRVLVPLVRRYTKNPRGITLLQRLGIGLVIHIVIMITACLAEKKRLSVARQHNLLGQHDILPLSIFILLPQFALAGIADTFVDVAKLDLFYDQAPEGMKSLGTSYVFISLSIGTFFSSFLISTVADLTKRNNGQKGWILDNLNVSHLDYYFAFLAILSAINFLCFLVAAKFFVYNNDATQASIIGLEMKNNNASSHDKMELNQRLTAAVTTIVSGRSTQKSVDKDTIFMLSTQKFVDQDTEPPFSIPSLEVGDLSFDDINFDLENILSETRQVYSSKGTMRLPSGPELSIVTPKAEKSTQAASTKEKMLQKKYSSSSKPTAPPSAPSRLATSKGKCPAAEEPAPEPSQLKPRSDPQRSQREDSNPPSSSGTSTSTGHKSLLYGVVKDVVQKFVSQSNHLITLSKEQRKLAAKHENYLKKSRDRVVVLMKFEITPIFSLDDKKGSSST
nr:protein NRT1/ PTR FAMILY 5.2-like [Arachis hypogaea]